MTTWISLVSLSLVLTKIFDAYSTWVAIQPSSETNPLGRMLIPIIGFKAMIVLVSAVSLILIGLCHYFTITFDNFLYSFAYILIGLFVALVQFDVARFNLTGRSLGFIRFVTKFYRLFTTRL